ncbi:DUF2934 domain-containing protein [Rhizobiales bacterium RZME27]|jgi:hypothetical protein|uniref:DUF2934 domain-containing protein n=1 Tax=Endobacterium cereale TaxID=2663029 RepID=A0A6A8A3S9_9HYPH|nr:DUF2934 domain-containing protein [Endobacterium cereale]MEB2846526.1 DUF2934 domain-containing protein [Endobacterium cereale]MQY45399.1 DUF2934 domain-containing protein [Endobacterium cereale]
MGTDREEWIAKRSYQLWEEAGRPEGQDHQHWVQASAEWDSGKAMPSSSKPAIDWDDDEY